MDDRTVLWSVALLLCPWNNRERNLVNGWLTMLWRRLALSICSPLAAGGLLERQLSLCSNLWCHGTLAVPTDATTPLYLQLIFEGKTDACRPSQDGIYDQVSGDPCGGVQG